MGNHSDVEHVTKDHRAESHVTGSSVFIEFARGVFDGSIETPLSYAGLKRPTRDIHPSPELKDVHEQGRMVGAGLDMVGAALLGHGLLKAIGGTEVVAKSLMAKEIPVEGSIQVVPHHGAFGMYGGEHAGYKVFKDRIDVTPHWREHPGDLPMQVKLEDGRAFMMNRDFTAHFIDTPSHIPGIGSLEYEPKRTIATNEHGKFTRNMDNRGGSSVTMEKPDGDKITMDSRNKISIRKAGSNAEVHFDRGRATHAEESPWSPSFSWYFNKDGTIDMHSRPSGAVKLHVDSDGNGVLRERYGTDRAVSGMVRSAVAKPFNQGTDELRLDPDTRTIGRFTVPDTTPVSRLDQARLTQMRDVLDQLASGK